MYKIFLFLLLQCTVFGNQLDDHTLKYTTRLASQYLSHGFDVSNDENVFQLDIKKSYSNGLDLAFWTNKSLEKTKSLGDEFDFYVSKTGQVYNSSIYYTFLIDYWNLYRTNNHKDGFKFGLNLDSSFKIYNGVFLTIKYNNYFWKSIGSGKFKSGFSNEFECEINKNINLIKQDRIGLSTKLVYHEGAFGVKPGVSHSILSFNYNLNLMDKSELKIGYLYQKSYEDSVNNEDENQFSIQLSSILF